MSQWEALNWLAAHPGWHKTVVIARGLGKRRYQIGENLRTLADHGDIQRRLLGKGLRRVWSSRFDRKEGLEAC